MDDESLFGDLGLGSVSVNSKSQRTFLIEEAWNLWVEATDRPKRRTPPKAFADCYGDQLDQGFSQDRLLRCVKAASYLPPHGRDHLDIRRVINVLTLENRERHALSLMEQGGSEVYKWIVEEIEDTLCSVVDIEQGLGTIRQDWSGAEQDAAGMLSTTFTSEDLAAAAIKIRRFLGVSSILPSDVMRNSSVWREGRPSPARKLDRTQNRDAYEGGAQESKSLSETMIDIDTEAEKLLLKGFPMDTVLAYHQDAPEGYWDSVSQIMKDQDLDPVEAYSKLQGKFDWTPYDRRKPAR